MFYSRKTYQHSPAFRIIRMRDGVAPEMLLLPSLESLMPGVVQEGSSSTCSGLPTLEPELCVYQSRITLIADHICGSENQQQTSPRCFVASVLFSCRVQQAPPCTGLGTDPATARSCCRHVPSTKTPPVTTQCRRYRCQHYSNEGAWMLFQH